MVSPSQAWDDLDSGYEKGDVRIIVGQTEGWGGDSTWEGYTVSVWDGPAGYESITEIASYEDPRKAWELANLLTHYIDEMGPSLMRLEDPTEGEVLPRDLDERDPEEMLRDVLGYNDFHLDRVLEQA